MGLLDVITRYPKNMYSNFFFAVKNWKNKLTSKYCDGVRNKKETEKPLNMEFEGKYGYQDWKNQFGEDSMGKKLLGKNGKWKPPEYYQKKESHKSKL